MGGFLLSLWGDTMSFSTGGTVWSNRFIMNRPAVDPQSNESGESKRSRHGRVRIPRGERTQATPGYPLFLLTPTCDGFWQTGSSGLAGGSVCGWRLLGIKDVQSFEHEPISLLGLSATDGRQVACRSGNCWMSLDHPTIHGIMALCSLA